MSDQAHVTAWLQEAENAIHGIGAQDVAVATSLPFRHEWDLTTFTDIIDHPTDPAREPNARLRFVSPNFFGVMGMQLVAGRPFTINDRASSELVAIVNQTWVRKYLPDLNPLRQRFLLFGAGQPLTVVGVVHDASYRDVTKDPEPAVFAPIAQNLRYHLTFVVTAQDGHPERLSRPIRSALGHLDSDVAVDMELLSDAVSRALVWPKLGLLLMLTFGGAALGLASVGVFGVIAFVTTQRQNEMAVRLALGGTAGHVFGLVLIHAARLAVGGAAAGLLLAWWMGQTMKNYVYEVSAGNIVVLAGSTAIVIGVALVATLPSARRAARTNPVRSLLR